MNFSSSYLYTVGVWQHTVLVCQMLKCNLCPRITHNLMYILHGTRLQRGRSSVARLLCYVYAGDNFVVVCSDRAPVCVT
jgi:hypothetical protein